MADVTAAPAPIVLSGRTYTMHPLTDKDYEEVNNWMRAKMLDLARSMLTPSMPQRERDEILRAAMAEARKVNWYDADDESPVERVEIIARLIFQGIKREHPDVRLEEVKKALMNPASLDDTMARWQELNVGVPPKGAQVTEGKLQGPKTGHRPRSKSTAN